jgi:large subunit ribosomal protein L6
MSRIGKQTIAVPDGVTLTVTKDSITVKGSKGELRLSIPACISIAVDGQSCEVTRTGDSKHQREMHGTIRSCIVNMIIGVKDGYKRILDIQGIGYRAEVQGSKLVMNLGKARPIDYTIPQGLEIEVEKNTRLIVSGIDKEKVGSAAAKIRSFYPPEPYKGKGIKFQDEHVRRKAGKTVAGG